MVSALRSAAALVVRKALTVNWCKLMSQVMRRGPALLCGVRDWGLVKSKSFDHQPHLLRVCFQLV